MITIAAAGDSVMWGQGLAESDKFTNLFARELPGAQRTLVGNESHSGAKVGDPPFGETFYDEIARKKGGWNTHPLSDRATQPTWGEIPSSTANIGDQLIELRAKTGAVDILLLNGGPNDVNFIGALQLEMSGYNSFVKKTRNELSSRVPQVLNQARRLFPEATIFYLGYYPGLSKSSKHSFETSMTGTLALSIGHFVVDMGKPDWGWFAAIYKGFMALFKGQRTLDQWNRQVDQFHHESLRAQATEVAKFNNNTPGNGVIFVNPGFKRHNAMHGSQSFVHQIDGAFDHSIARNRTRYYRHLRPDHFANIQVEFGGPAPLIEKGKSAFAVWKVANAHLAHPNKAGARRYADKLGEMGREVVHFSLRAALKNHGLPRNEITLSKLRMGYGLRGKSVRGLLNMTQLSTIEVQIIPTGGQRSPGYLSVRINIGDGWKHMDSLFMGPPVQVAEGFEGVMDFHGDSKLSRVKRIWVSFREKMDMRSFSARILVRVNGHLAVDDTFTYRPGLRHTRLTQGRVSLIYLAKNIL